MSWTEKTSKGNWNQAKAARPANNELLTSKQKAVVQENHFIRIGGYIIVLGKDVVEWRKRKSVG